MEWLSKGQMSIVLFAIPEDVGDNVGIRVVKGNLIGGSVNCNQGTRDFW